MLATKRWARSWSAHYASTVRASQKCSISTNRKSTMHFPTSHRWTMYVTPNSRKGWHKTQFFAVFARDPTPFQTQRFSPISAHSASAVRASKKVQLSLTGSRQRAFHQAIDKPCALPISPPKGGSKREFLHLALPFISLLQVIIDTSSLVCILIIASPNLQMTNCPWNGRGHCHVTSLTFAK